MNRTTSLLIVSLGLATAVGCYTGPNGDLTAATHGAGVSADGTEPTPRDEGAPTEGTAPDAQGLPCDVAKVLATSCTDCHGARLTGGAPNHLVTYDDLVAPSEDEPTKTVAEVSLARMKATKKPMPPDGDIRAEDVAVLERWVSAKMPKGSCATQTVAPDGGPLPADAGVTDSAPPKDAAPAPTVCTSGTTWAQGTPSSALMAPGKACLACHAATGGPTFTIAGTVYPTLHEPNSCNGVPGGMTVVIVDAAGKSHSMPVNAAGNFTRVTGIPMPYKAMVVNGTKVREMKTPQTDGDCNGCHSEQGNHSPGRVMAP
jgi:mono/diheme cytochrome c family protein